MVENFRVMSRVLNCCLGIESEKRVSGEALGTLNRLENKSCLELVSECGEDVDRFSVSVQSYEVKLLGFRP